MSHSAKIVKTFATKWSLYLPPAVRFNYSTFRPHSVFMCFVWIWEQTAIISLYSINWLVFITETECLLRGTDWVFIYNSTFCPHSVFMCFVWIWEQTAIISLYSIQLLIFLMQAQCSLCGTNRIIVYKLDSTQAVSRRPRTAEVRFDPRRVHMKF